MADLDQEYSDLRRMVMSCTRCRFYRWSKQRVVGSGSPHAALMVVGEAPGETEDRLGEAFVGRSGDKLDEWFTEVGLSRGMAYLTNVLHCAPVEQDDDGTHRRIRWPEDGPEPNVCRKWLWDLMRLIQPRFVVLAGKRALHYVLLDGSTVRADPIAPWVGRICRRRDLYGETRFGVILHPAHILRSGNPIDEAACLSVMRVARDYLAARQSGRPAPVCDLIDIKTVVPGQSQGRFRLFVPDQGASGEKVST